MLRRAVAACAVVCAAAAACDGEAEESVTLSILLGDETGFMR